MREGRKGEDEKSKESRGKRRRKMQPSEDIGGKRGEGGKE